MTKPSILELPAGVQLVYLAEGGANVIYRFVATPVKSALDVEKDPKWSLGPITIEGIEQATVLPWLKGKLLRLRKDTAADIPYTEISHTFDTTVRPLFKPDELLDQTLIRLPEGLIQRCNEQLHIAELNGQRPKKRHGGYLCLHEPFGLLITDMTTYDDPGATLAELKPKWLTQSPTAPTLAHRCRTCALREMKNNDAQRAELKQQRSFCPLDLVSERFENVLRATSMIKGCRDRDQLARILYRNPTLVKLQSLQKSWARVGMLGPSPLSRATCLDMTIRDCTMYIKIPHDESSPIEVRLGDLDLKTSAGGKAKYWRDIEFQLIDGGWYSGSNTSQYQTACTLQSI